MDDLSDGLKSLGDKKKGGIVYDGPDSSLLETFPNPFALAERNKNKASGTIHIEAPEFTSLCPKTGQPDFATIVVDYQPDETCVESKSFKLYLTSFRMAGEFHESCVARICNDLVDLLNPHSITVEGRFTTRGGITFWPKAAWSK